MNKKNIFTDVIRFEKHESSYFNLPASIVTVVAYFLPGLLNLLFPVFSYFATLILLAVAGFERKSGMVRLYCIQLCFYSMFFNILMTALYYLAHFSPVIQMIAAVLSVGIGFMTIFVFLYSLYNALNYKFWKIPFVSDFVIRKFFQS